MKGELKQTLASVRDYLLNMELPSTEFSSILEALSDSDSEKVIMQGSLATPTESTPTTEKEEELEELEEPEEESLEPESELSLEDELEEPHESLVSEPEPLTEDDLMTQDEDLEPEEEQLPDEETIEPDEYEESELSFEEEPQMEYDRIDTEANQSIPKVNLLANLMTWVARAKKEIGYEQLPLFLEVYGISGHLSPELKESILHLAEITTEEADEAHKAEVWSRSMLTLHGILTGGHIPLNPIKPDWITESGEIPPGEDEIIEVDKPKDSPVKLKLVFPDSEGESKEFCINLTPETDSKDT
jgi:hypothetical protein